MPGVSKLFNLEVYKDVSRTGFAVCTFQTASFIIMFFLHFADFICLDAYL